MASLQFNSHADDQDIVHTTWDLVNADANSYPLKALTRAANSALRTVWSWIFDAYGGIQYEDTNQTDLPRATIDLVANTNVYAIPSDSLTIRAIEIHNDATSVAWTPLRPTTYERINQTRAIAEATRISSTPVSFAQIGNTFELIPPPLYSRTAGMKVYFDRGSVSFASTDTTKLPGFASEFHDAIAIGAAFAYAKRKDLPQKIDLRNDWADMGNRIKKYYQERYQALYPPRMTVRDAVADNR